jgi:hypothetical protein
MAGFFNDINTKDLCNVRLNPLKKELNDKKNKNNRFDILGIAKECFNWANDFGQFINAS